MGRATWIAVVAAVLTLTGCDEDEPTAQGSEAAPEPGDPGPAPAVAAKLEDHRLHLDLLRLAHLADVSHRGLFIDFGTPARMKYTIGHWRTEWGSDGSSGDTTFTYAGKRGRVYFSVDDPGPLTIRLRLRPVGTTVVSPYVNGEGIELIRLEEGSGFRDYDVKVPDDKVVRGENVLMLVFGETTKVGNEDVSVAMESIRVVQGHDVKGEFVPPTYDSLLADVDLEGTKRRALTVRRPATMSFFVHVPADAKLSFGVGLEGKGQAPVEVRIRPDGGEAKPAFEGKATGTWQDHVVDLSGHAGKVARIDFVSAEGGSGRVAWAAPSIHVPKPDEAHRPDQPRNVVVLLIDTLRASKLKPYNPRSRVKAPHLERVAEEGTVFELAQSPENWTKPSCASILTTLYPATHGAKQDASRLPAGALTMGEHLQANGFKTGSFIANGYVSRKFGFDQGWDHYTNYIREKKSTEAENVFKEAGDWIEAHKGERFFAYIQTIDPHVPYDPPEKFLEMYDPQPYDGQVRPRMTADLLAKAKKNPPAVTFSERDKQRLEALHDGEISYHDEHMGKFIERMRSLGVWDDTLFVITSDHGEEFGEHGSWGHGHSTFQELLHVPLIFRLPGVVPGSHRVPQVVSTLDIAPTVLELLGISRMPKAEGRSLVGYLTGVTPEGPSVAFSDFLDDHRVITVGRYKLVLRGLNVDLYDLEADPGEQNELDPNSRPVAMRYARILLGQFLGAKDRARWLEAEQGPGTALQSEETHIDEETRGQLRALGYAN